MECGMPFENSTGIYHSHAAFPHVTLLLIYLIYYSPRGDKTACRLVNRYKLFAEHTTSIFGARIEPNSENGLLYDEKK
jgi:hypothetical protein